MWRTDFFPSGHTRRCSKKKKNPWAQKVFCSIGCSTKIAAGLDSQTRRIQSSPPLVQSAASGSASHPWVGVVTGCGSRPPRTAESAPPFRRDRALTLVPDILTEWLQTSPCQSEVRGQDTKLPSAQGVWEVYAYMYNKAVT